MRDWQEQSYLVKSATSHACYYLQKKIKQQPVPKVKKLCSRSIPNLHDLHDEALVHYLQVYNTLPFNIPWCTCREQACLYMKVSYSLKKKKKSQLGLETHTPHRTKGTLVWWGHLSCACCVFKSWELYAIPCLFLHQLNLWIAVATEEILPNLQLRRKMDAAAPRFKFMLTRFDLWPLHGLEFLLIQQIAVLADFPIWIWRGEREASWRTIKDVQRHLGEC